MSASQSSERRLDPVVVNVFEPSASEGESPGENPSHVCEENCWADIIYMPGTRTFWLLTEEVSDALMEASETLREWVSTEDKKTRIELLTNEAGLMECLLPSRAESFLNGSERQQYIENFNRLVALTSEDLPSVQQRIAHERGLSDILWDLSTPGLLNHIARFFSNSEISDIESQLRALYQQGVARAEGQGYSLEGEAYYGPWEEEIAQALETYRVCREQTQRQYHFNPGSQGTATPFSLRDVLSEYQRFIQLCESNPPVEAAQACQFVGYVQELNEQQAEKYHEYLQSILSLAALGIATPELALSGTSNGGAGVDDGVSGFDTYCRLLKESAELNESVEQKLSEWESGTAGRAQLPVFLFEQERQQYERLHDELDELFKKANRAVEQIEPGRVLIWNTNLDDDQYSLGYEKRKIERLVRREFPLREFSSPLGDKSLCHISLWQLAPLMSETERERLDQALGADGVLPATLWEAPETALTQWLASRGCERIEHQLSWHEDTLGFFQPDDLFSYLEQHHYQVESLTGDNKTRWGKALQKILFTGPGRESLRLFDASAQAQMLRLVGMTHFDLNEERSEDERDVPWNAEAQSGSLTFFDGELTFEEKSGASVTRNEQLELARDTAGEWSLNDKDKTAAKLSYGWEGKGTISLARGELPLGRLVLPQKSQALPVSIELAERNETRNLGRYTVVLDAVAKGFAGASAVLSSELGFDFDKDGLSITGVDWAKREAQGAEFDAFAGAKLGIETRCALHWEPPENLQRLLPTRAALSELAMQGSRRSVTGWRSLGNAKLGVEASIGIGAKAGFLLRIQGGKFTLVMSARLVVGKGVGGSLAIDLDVDSLDLWLSMLHRAMVDNNYVQPEWVDEEAYETLGFLGYLAATTLLNVGLLAARGKAGIEQLYNAMTGGQNAGPIAYEIVNAADRGQGEQLANWIQQLTPEALGALLYLLISEPRSLEIEGQNFGIEDALDYQQIAVANCLGWIVEGVTTGIYGSLCRFSKEDPTPSQYLFAKAVIRMTENGQPPHNYSDTAYLNHKERLDKFMERVSDSGSLIEREAGIARAEYRNYVAGLATEVCATN
ncbi:hypothetical protein [Vreelandella sulfidaeris]|uniref:hypothetical protein n=1 Tax=Vreelandella sulfidaeris TaxID=115553 RepID=UPI0035E49125